MTMKRFIALLMTCVMTVTAFAGCGKQQGANDQTTPTPQAGGQTAEAVDEVVDIEVWDTNNGFLPIEKDSPLYNFYKEKFGVGIIQPYVEWNGGTGYSQQLNLKIAAGEMPDVFIPWGGIEKDLAKNGALLDLTDLLPEKAPNLWNMVSEEVWNVMKTYDPTGSGRIYTTPNVSDYNQYGGLIRKDWLDKLRLSMPTTQEEFVNVLKAFRDQDPNGNGLKDEIPTGGRAEARWMDHLFAMYGIAMKEGYPQWDIYEGELTYSAVTKNMGDCLEWLSQLYAEGLLDPETLLNDKAKWDGKVNSDRVGVFFRILQEMYMYPEAIEKSTGVKAEYVLLPAISAPGYEAYYTQMSVKGTQYVVKNQKDQKKIDASLKFLNEYSNQETWYDLYLGVEGQHHKVENGTKAKLPDDKTKQQNLLQPYNSMIALDFHKKLLEESSKSDPNRKWALDQAYNSLNEIQKNSKIIAGDGIPALVYTNYPDIENRVLFVEYATKIITGEYPISKFDEFVDKWYQTGGTEVTKAAREWYSQMTK